MTREEAIEQIYNIGYNHVVGRDDLIAFGVAIEALAAIEIASKDPQWIPCTEPPKDERNVFLAHGTNDFKSCCIGHYDHSMKLWYEDKNWFASPIYDCKYWCEIPELPDMGDKQFEMPCRNEGERK